MSFVNDNNYFLTCSIIVAIFAVLDEVMASSRNDFAVEFKVHIAKGCLQTNIALLADATIDQCLPIQNS